MRLYHALAIGSWFIFIHQGSATNSSDVCSGITNILSGGTSRILRLSVNDSTITPTNNCSCEIMTDHPVMFLCLYNQSASCLSCSSDECLSSDVDSNNNQMCISVNLIYPRASERNDSCPTSTNLTINLSMKSSSECTGTSNGNTVNLIAFGSCNDSLRAFLNATCRSVTTEASSTTVTSSAWNSWSTSATTFVDTETTSRPWQTTGWSSTTRVSTTLSSTSLTSAIRTEVYSSTVQNGTSSDKSADKATSSQTSLTTEMIIGIGIGVACGVLLIIAIIVVFIIRKLRAGSNKRHVINHYQATAAPSETPYTSYTDLVSAANVIATSDTTLSYQTIPYDHETVGGINDEYAEIRKAEAISNPNSCDYITSEIARNDSHDTSNAMRGDNDIVNENTSTNIKNESSVIDGEFAYLQLF